MKTAANFEERVEAQKAMIRSGDKATVPAGDGAYQEAALRLVEAGEAHAVEIVPGQKWEVRPGPGESDYYFPLVSRLKSRMMGRMFT